MVLSYTTSWCMWWWATNVPLIDGMPGPSTIPSLSPQLNGFGKEEGIRVEIKILKRGEHWVNNTGSQTMSHGSPQKLGSYCAFHKHYNLKPILLFSLDWF